MAEVDVYDGGNGLKPVRGPEGERESRGRRSIKERVAEAVGEGLELKAFTHSLGLEPAEAVGFARGKGNEASQNLPAVRSEEKAVVELIKSQAEVQGTILKSLLSRSTNNEESVLIKYMISRLDKFENASPENPIDTAQRYITLMTTMREQFGAGLGVAATGQSGTMMLQLKQLEITMQQQSQNFQMRLEEMKQAREDRLLAMQREEKWREKEYNLKERQVESDGRRKDDLGKKAMMLAESFADSLESGGGSGGEGALTASLPRSADFVPSAFKCHNPKCQSMVSINKADAQRRLTRCQACGLVYDLTPQDADTTARRAPPAPPVAPAPAETAQPTAQASAPDTTEPGIESAEGVEGDSAEGTAMSGVF